MTDEEKQQARKIDKEKKAHKRANMTEEEKLEIREKDRLRKAKKYGSLTEEEKLKQTEANKRKWADKKAAMPCKKKPKKPYSYGKELDKNLLYQKNRRQEMSEAEAEFERIQNLLIKRNTRAKRTIEEKKEQDSKAKSGMQLMPFMPLKSRRQSKGQREEYLWWKFWKMGKEYEELIRTKLPEYGEKFAMWVSKSQNPYKVEEEKEEKLNSMSLREKMDERNKLRRKLVKEQLDVPIEMPEMEQSEYEEIREQIIVEWEQEFQKYLIEHGLDK